jgi:7-carboxy-7-deazaguanine synthase
VSELVVNEIYGPVWQGEGPSAGRICSFIRFMGCNLDCSWTTADGGRSPCDESQTWDASRFDLRAQGHAVEAAEIASRAVAASGGGMVVITGGEPLLHQNRPGWAEMLRVLTAARVRVEFETNGTQLPNSVTRRSAAQFNVSPKLPSSGVSRDRAFSLPALDVLASDRRAVFKFVVTKPAELDNVAMYVEALKIPARRVWIMPVGDTADMMIATAQYLAPFIGSYGWSLTLRQHLLVHEGGKEPR